MAQVTDMQHLHLITGLIEALCPDQGYIVHILPPTGQKGMPILMANMEMNDVLGTVQGFLRSAKEGKTHDMLNGQSLKN